MIAGVRGKVVGRQASSILLEVGGFVLQIGVPLSTLQAAGERGASVYLHTYLHLRADAMSLFGFSSEDELTAFLDLLNVNGVGPKVALAILSRFDPKQLERIIGEGEPQNLSTVSGVGKKLAGRIVLELPRQARDETCRHGAGGRSSDSGRANELGLQAGRLVKSRSFGRTSGGVGTRAAYCSRLTVFQSV